MRRLGLAAVERISSNDLKIALREPPKTVETYSIVIPAYNEQARIGATLERIMECVATKGWAAEVLVVNDGSSDATREIVTSAIRRYPNLRLIENGGNRGKGYSVRNGVLHSRGAIVMFTDADLSAPIEEAELLFSAIAGGADVAIGSRWLDRSRQTLQQPIYRRFFGRCFNWLTRLVMHLPLADTQCGFKAFRQDAAQTIFIRQRIERWGFDPEILYIALRLGMRVEEVAVTWGHDDRSRISYLKDGLKMIQDLVLVRYYSLTGRYDDPSVNGVFNRRGNFRPESRAVTHPTTRSAGHD